MNLEKLIRVKEEISSYGSYCSQTAISDVGENSSMKNQKADSDICSDRSDGSRTEKFCFCEDAGMETNPEPKKQSSELEIFSPWDTPDDPQLLGNIVKDVLLDVLKNSDPQ
ncbi:hypothetical protein [Tichowtungia aerotolerans]|uniref:Uncharacterized protein n=1 Tax=Tichowtungia aerotolerans TaxID=2697043 RepID=A0A6P1MAG6_9BACT|nr:hypothetical protein [Tichowtungia aerotolerans]QHI69544.1 hypothetical protein GT409_08765 [Tichowtungia aerotolerans]